MSVKSIIMIFNFSEADHECHHLPVPFLWAAWSTGFILYTATSSSGESKLCRFRWNCDRCWWWKLVFQEGQISICIKRASHTNIGGAQEWLMWGQCEYRTGNFLKSNISFKIIMASQNAGALYWSVCPCVRPVRKKWLSPFCSTYWCYIHQTCANCSSWHDLLISRGGLCPWPTFHAWVTMVRKKWLSQYYSTYWCYIHQTCTNCSSWYDLLIQCGGLCPWPTFHASVTKAQNGNSGAPVMVPITIMSSYFRFQGCNLHWSFIDEHGNHNKSSVLKLPTLKTIVSGENVQN